MKSKFTIFLLLCLLLTALTPSLVTYASETMVPFESQSEITVDRIWVTDIASPWTYYLTMIPDQKTHTVVHNGYLYRGTVTAYRDEFRGWTEWRRFYQGYLYNTGIQPASLDN